MSRLGDIIAAFRKRKEHTMTNTDEPEPEEPEEPEEEPEEETLS